MQQKYENKLVKIGFLLAITILILLSTLSYVTYQKSYNNEKWVRHTYNVLHQSKELFSTIKDAETAQRGYVLSGNNKYLDQLKFSSTLYKTQYAELKDLVKDNSKQKLRVSILKNLIEDKYNYSYKVVEIRQKEGQQSAAKVVQLGEGKRLMDEIRLIFKEIDAEEEILLSERELKTKKSINTSRAVLFLGTFITIILFLIIFFSLFKEIKKRKANQELLFVQNEWYTQTLISIGDGVITTDPNGKIIMLNKAAAAIGGWTVEEVLGQPLESVFTIFEKETGNKSANPAMVALKENRTVFLAQDTILKDKYGNEIYIDDSGAPIHDREGNIIGSVLIFRNITEKKKAEEERDLFYKLSIDMIGKAQGGKFISINPAFCNVLGYTEKEFLSKGYLEMIHDDDIEATIEEVKKLESGKPTVHFVNRYLCKSGEYKSIEWNVIPVKDILYALGRDITERLKAEEKINAAYRKFYQILESNPVAIIITQIKSGKINYVNDAFSKMVGIDKNLLLDNSSNSFDNLSLNEFEKIIQQIMRKDGNKKEIESELKTADGKSINVLYSIEPIEIDGVLCYIGSFIDITQRKKFEEEIKQLNQNLEKRVEERTDELQSQKKFTDEILNKIPTEIAVYDHEKKYLYVNPKGIENEEIRDWIIGKTDFDYCKLKGIDLSIATRRHESFEKIKHNETAEWIDELVTEDNTIHYMLRILHPLENNKYILTGYDITELKKAEQEKEQYIKDLEEMMFITSHKVRHPVTQIIGITNLMEESLTQEEVEKVIGYLKQSANSLDSFTKELTMFIYDLKKRNDKKDPNDLS